MTKKVQIEIIKATMENTLRCAELFKRDGNMEAYNRNFLQYLGLKEAYDILTNKSFAKEIGEIFGIA